ncbi:MAG TPA: ATP-binding protein [Steroidobacteraceae bacterium]
MTFRLWPQSLFGRLMAASIIALLLAQVVSLVMIARERERFILQGSVREWSRRIAEVTTVLQGMDDTERSAMISRLNERPWRFGHRPPDAFMFRDGLVNGPEGDPAAFPGPGGRGGRGHDGPQGDTAAPGARPPTAGRPSEPRIPPKTEQPGEPLAPPDVPPDAVHPDQVPPPAAQQSPDALRAHRDRDQQGRHPGPMGPPPEDTRSLVLRATTYPAVVPFTKAGDFEPAFEEELRKDLGPGFETQVTQTADPTEKSIPIGGPLFAEVHDSGAEFYDAKVKFPDGYSAVFRVTRYSRGAPLPRGLFMNLALLVIVMSIALWVVARSITRPLSDLARAADSVGRDLRQPKLVERGAREIRNAARAFNTMQDRMQRYLDSRSRVLAAMSHDLKTPLTRLRLQVEMLDDSAAQLKLGRQLDEMESMVHGALALFRGLDDNEAFTPVDINEMLATLQSEFAEMSAQVLVQGHAARSILGKPQALRRCLTNLLANAIKFGSQASVIVEDGTALVIRIRDEGPGIPDEELERVFEPFYRLESSRNRDTGGSGLGLSIARDVIQAHGGSLILQNLPVRGLEAIVSLPRA